MTDPTTVVREIRRICCDIALTASPSCSHLRKPAAYNFPPVLMSHTLLIFTVTFVNRLPDIQLQPGREIGRINSPPLMRNLGDDDDDANASQNSIRFRPSKALPFPQASLIASGTRSLNRAEWFTVEFDMWCCNIAVNRLELVLVFVLGPLILRLTCRQESYQDSNDQNEPEDVDGLQDCEQSKRDDLGDPAFVLLRVPVEVVWSDGRELTVREQ